MTFNPGVMLLLSGAALLYVRAVRVLRRRGFMVRRRQQAAWWVGFALFSVALLGPPDALADRSLALHMVQHLLIADLAAPLVLAGIRWPVHVFLLPRPALVAVARQRGLRRVAATLVQPLVAIPAYVLLLYGWHLAPAFEAALKHDAVHVLQHQSFVLASILVWWSALEPNRRRLRGELWKVGHILGARIAGMFLGMAFIAMRSPVYTDAYGERERWAGLTPVADQQLGGGLMLSLDFFVVLFALTFFFWHAAADEDRTQSAPG